jgi:hypothetical protein
LNISKMHHNSVPHSPALLFFIPHSFIIIFIPIISSILFKRSSVSSILGLLHS